MLSPDDETNPVSGEEIAFVVRWNKLVDVLIVEPSIKLVARAAADYGVRDGMGIFPGNERLARQTSYDTKTVAHAWKVLRGLGMAERYLTGGWDGERRTSDEYNLVIPDGWRGLPVYGPTIGRFRCLYCGHKYNPRPGTVVHDDGSVGWYLCRMAFCPPPGTPRKQANGRRPAQPASCQQLWEKANGRWPSDGKGWDLFRQARDDEWK